MLRRSFAYASQYLRGSGFPGQDLPECAGICRGGVLGQVSLSSGVNVRNSTAYGDSGRLTAILFQLAAPAPVLDGRPRTGDLEEISQTNLALSPSIPCLDYGFRPRYAETEDSHF